MALISQLRAAFVADRQGVRRRRRLWAARGCDGRGRQKRRMRRKRRSVETRVETAVKTVVVEQRWEGADDPWPELRQQEAAQPKAAQH